MYPLKWRHVDIWVLVNGKMDKIFIELFYFRRKNTGTIKLNPQGRG